MPIRGVKTMKYFIKIVDYEWAPGSQKKMIYKDEDGSHFMGPAFNIVVGETILVEASNHPIEGYYQIIRFIGHVSDSKK